MRKIPTVFVRDFTEPSNGRYVINEVTPGCEWVLDGEGVPTRKYDGTCVMLDDAGQWWARRTVKPDQSSPLTFVPVETDTTTGIVVGWTPVKQSAFVKAHTQAVESHVERRPGVPLFAPGTYELCGPKVNGNPEDYTRHMLVRHDDAEVIEDAPRTFHGLAGLMSSMPYEGIVWHHPDGRMAKLKRRDFRKDSA